MIVILGLRVALQFHERNLLLIITSSTDATADYLCQRLVTESVRFIRFNTDVHSSSLRIDFDVGRASLCIDGTRVTTDTISNVWFRRPEALILDGFKDVAEEQHARDEWSEALEGVLGHIQPARWMNHPAKNFVASHKLEQLTRASAMRLAVPKSLVSSDRKQIRAFWEQCNRRLIAKPLSAGYVDRGNEATDCIIYTSLVRDSDLLDIDCVADCPTLFQEQLSKRLDVRITVVDEFVHATTLSARDDGQQRLDIRRDNMSDVTYRHIEVPSEIVDTLNTLVSSYDLRFAAIDMAIDQDGRWIFLELNPNGQWAWLDIAGGMDVAAGFVNAFRTDQDELD